MTDCERCAHYIYDDQMDYYYCDINLDEDEMARFMSQNVRDCNYFNYYDEYKIVRKQN